MDAAFPQPMAVAITMPRTSPIAQPVRQWVVALSAERLSEACVWAAAAWLIEPMLPELLGTARASILRPRRDRYAGSLSQVPQPFRQTELVLDRVKTEEQFLPYVFVRRDLRLS